MKALALLALACLLAVQIHAQEEGAAAEGEEAKGEAKADAKAAPAAKAPGRELPSLPVNPLSYDDHVLKEDDKAFDRFAPKTVQPGQTVTELVEQLKKATTLLNAMRKDLEGEKEWVRNVFDIIQNYEFKYTKTLQDVKIRKRKVAQLSKLVDLLKAAALHAGVEKELGHATKALDELTARASDIDPTLHESLKYRHLKAKIAELKTDLEDMPHTQTTNTQATKKMKEILAVPDDAPPTTGALRRLMRPPHHRRPKKHQRTKTNLRVNVH
jgi:DNA repair exonuclease SbcCD ATPase subunit